MCKACENTDREICELCGGSGYKSNWSVQRVILDDDHRGELIVKLTAIVEDKDMEIRKILDKELEDRWLLELERLIQDRKAVEKLCVVVRDNKVTNRDLEVIDCL